MSQRELAGVSGIPQPNLSAIEHDRRLPSADTLNRILVSCGYELAAVAGDRIVYAPLPQGGWFPDEEDPGPVDGDPADEAPVLPPDAPMDQRVQVIDAVLGAVDAFR